LAPRPRYRSIAERSRLIPKLPVTPSCYFVKTPIRVLTCAYVAKVGAPTWKRVLPLFLAEGVLVT
jgi:hypothetical protein